MLSAMKDFPDEPDVLVTYGDLAMKHRVPGEATEAYRRAVFIIQSQQHEIERLREIEKRLASAISAQGNGASSVRMPTSRPKETVSQIPRGRANALDGAMLTSPTRPPGHS